MATPPVQQMVDPHDVVMTGENSFIRLSQDGGKSLVTRASHWRVLWSPAGQGHVLFLETKSIRIYSDNVGMTRYLQQQIEKLLYEPFADPKLPVVDARFERTGHSLATVEERISTQKDSFVLSWWDFIDPFILTMPPGAMKRPLGVYSTFIPARSAQLTVNGEAMPGEVFEQERFGKPSSSCCLAWSESWTRPRK
ncbi:hypothetical protein AYO46_01130 [Betaproteobacteria bacterium SCGC AG-212-J23]|nr:hypothetical protein AYO46_01130 [Betaproteobacteria bacterium SCGC AG-212-J23]